MTDDTFTRFDVTFTRIVHGEGGSARYFWRSQDRRIQCWSRCIEHDGKVIKQYLVRVDGADPKHWHRSLIEAMEAGVKQAFETMEIAA
jgi:hypothetical protein